MSEEYDSFRGKCTSCKKQTDVVKYSDEEIWCDPCLIKNAIKRLPRLKRPDWRLMFPEKIPKEEKTKKKK